MEKRKWTFLLFLAVLSLLLVGCGVELPSLEGRPQAGGVWGEYLPPERQTAYAPQGEDAPPLYWEGGATVPEEDEELPPEGGAFDDSTGTNTSEPPATTTTLPDPSLSGNGGVYDEEVTRANGERVTVQHTPFY